jgi:predicted flavoprotein YhiN
MEDYHWVMVTHAKECTSLKKYIPEHFFTSVLNDFTTKDLVTFDNLLLI